MKDLKNDPSRVFISVPEAINKTTYWRNFIRQVIQFRNPNKLTKGVFISKADILAMAKSCEADESIIGVRTYFTLENDHVQWPYENEVKFVMVLVKESKGYANGKDVINVSNGGEHDEDESGVYDFTLPCPDCCDPSSVLFEGDQENP